MNGGGSWPVRTWLRAGIAAGCLLAARLTGADPVPVMIQSAPGRFEISAVDPSVAHAIAAEAQMAWATLAAPFGLPEAFSSPIYFRIEAAGTMPAAGAGPDRPSFRAAIEPGGIVSLRLRAEEASETAVRRALVHGLLLRTAVARHGVTEFLTCPVWLEGAGVEWWRTRAEASRLDEQKQMAGRRAPPAIETLLLARAGADGGGGRNDAAFWLLTVLQAESGRAQEWPTFLARLLAGDDPLIALVESYPGRFDNPRDRELWWQTSFHHARRTRTLPVLEVAESRQQLTALTRFVVADRDGESDRVASLREFVARRQQRLVAAELKRRAAELAKLLPVLHPYYRNAGVALADVLALRDVVPRLAEKACVAFDADWRSAIELEAATTAALDRLESR